ncbi:serum paraoxonase/arylesterase 2-like [Watersipora subatra]|uniref:serum paraoxonase/arylesterase 2-like n=1 Tax=Watersipora subatra TaxID=2589382 RepID=UPI00355B18F8
MNVFVKFLFLGCAVVVARYLWSFWFHMNGYGNEVIKHYPGKCELVKGFQTDGSEDMTLLPSGQLIISSGIGWEGLRDFDYSKNVAMGGMYVMDTASSTNTVTKLKMEGWPADSHFEPHGIDHWINADNSVSIFVVIHTPERVARFLYDGKDKLTLKKIYRNPLMVNINSVAAQGEDSFYLTNLFNAEAGNMLSTLLEIFSSPGGHVVHVKGDDYKPAAAGFFMSNGITSDEKYVYVATHGAVQIFTKNADHTLTVFKVIPVEVGSIDNIVLDSDGDLWLGCQTVLADAFAYMQNYKELTCASQVIRIRQPLGAAEKESVFADDGSMLQAVSVGLYAKGKLFIGTVIDKMASCDVNYLHGK